MELLLILVALYFVPWIIAAARSHHNAGAICALNLLLGWTLLGWIAALVWAFTAPQKKVSGPESAASAQTPKPQRSPAAEIERLARLKNDGTITEEEFLQLKQKALQGQ